MPKNSTAISVRIEGLEDIGKNAAQLQRRITRGAMRVATSKAARPILQMAKRLVTVRTGALKKSLKLKIKTDTKNDTVLAIVGPSLRVVEKDAEGNNIRPAYYAHLVEFGTSARGVHGRKGAKQRPGTPPKPFLRPAWQSKKTEATDIYRRELKAAIPQAARRVVERTRYNPRTRQR